MSRTPPALRIPKPPPFFNSRYLTALIAISLLLIVCLLAFVSETAPLVTHSATDRLVKPAKCPHLVLFSSARHGSTWFIDSVEKCRYSRSDKRLPSEPFAPDVFKATEPWKHRRSPIFDLSGTQVARYVRHNSSVKIFSSTMQLNKQGVLDLIAETANLHLPVVILRREPKATYESLRVAKHSGVWNGNRNSSGLDSHQIDQLIDQQGFQRYKASMTRHYASIHQMLADAGVTWVDTVDYDHVKGYKYIRLKTNNCYVRNCNFP